MLDCMCRTSRPSYPPWKATLLKLRHKWMNDCWGCRKLLQQVTLHLVSGSGNGKMQPTSHSVSQTDRQPASHWNRPTCNFPIWRKSWETLFVKSQTEITKWGALSSLLPLMHRSSQELNMATFSHDVRLVTCCGCFGSFCFIWFLYFILISVSFEFDLWFFWSGLECNCNRCLSICRLASWLVG